MRRSSLVFTSLVALACGGEVLVYPGQGDAGPGCTPAGARLCGGACGSVSDCAGQCTPLVAGDSSSSAYGVCFSDLPDKGQTPCAVCGAGEGCVQRSPDAFVCVPLDVCASLHAFGAGDVCWYGDKSPFDGRAIVAPAACPDQDPNLHPMCGGACGSCMTKYSHSLDRCIGQSPDHPVGLCTSFDGNPEDPASYPRCIVTGGAVSSPCPDTTPVGGSYACAVYPSPPAEQSVAERNGLCLPWLMCSGLQTSLPGGLDCY